MASSAASSRAAAARNRSGATEISRSLTVESPVSPPVSACPVAPSPARMPPTNCRMMPSPPLKLTVPDCGCTSPAISRISVVFPDPFGPTSAAMVPSPTRNDASSISTLPSGSA